MYEVDPIPYHPEQEQDRHEQLAMATVEAAVSSASVVRVYQTGEQVTEKLDDKDDRSILTRTDLQSEWAAKDVLQARYPDVPILGEETGLTSSSSEEVNMFLADPIDGTRPFLAGASTSTTIVSLYNKERQQVTAATIVEPATGRTWHSDGTQTVRTAIDLETGEQTADLEPCHVWEGSVYDNPTVLIDNFAAFKHEGRQVLDTEGVVRLFTGLQQHAAIQNYGSNGIHQALVANGGGKLAGSITTAMGGEWDTGGALLVMNAGGVATGLRVNEDRSLSPADPLDPFSYDILITANNDETLAFLQDKVIASFSVQ